MRKLFTVYHSPFTLRLPLAVYKVASLTLLSWKTVNGELKTASIGRRYA